MSIYWRERARTALEAYFRRHSFPRTALSIILSVTGLVGFVISFALLHLGLKEMWLRYPIAVFAAYGVFLGLVRGWAELERRRFRPQPSEVEQWVENTRPGMIGEGYSEIDARDVRDARDWWHWLDGPSDCDAEGCLFGVLFGVVVGLLAIVLAALADAPALLAEVFLDAFLVGALYRKLKIAEQENWLGTAIKRTLGAVLLTALLMAIGGACLQALAPGAHSIGPAIEKLRHP